MLRNILKWLLFLSSLIFFVVMLITHLDSIIDDSESVSNIIIAAILGTIGYTGLFWICRKR